MIYFSSCEIFFNFLTKYENMLININSTFKNNLYIIYINIYNSNKYKYLRFHWVNNKFKYEYL